MAISPVPQLLEFYRQKEREGQGEKEKERERERGRDRRREGGRGQEGEQRPCWLLLLILSHPQKGWLDALPPSLFAGGSFSLKEAEQICFIAAKVT